MKKIKWYQYFAVGAFVSGWLARATMVLPGEDRPRITPEERQELGDGLILMINDMLGGDIEL